MLLNQLSQCYQENFQEIVMSVCQYSKINIFAKYICKYILSMKRILCKEKMFYSL